MINEVRDRLWAEFSEMGVEAVHERVNVGLYAGKTLKYALEWLRQQERLQAERAAERVAASTSEQIAESRRLSDAAERAAAAAERDAEAAERAASEADRAFSASERSAAAAERAALATEAQAHTAKTALTVAKIAIVIAAISVIATIITPLLGESGWRGLLPSSWPQPPASASPAS